MRLTKQTVPNRYEEFECEYCGEPFYTGDTWLAVEDDDGDVYAGVCSRSCARRVPKPDHRNWDADVIAPNWD